MGDESTLWGPPAGTSLSEGRKSPCSDCIGDGGVALAFTGGVVLGRVEAAVGGCGGVDRNGLSDDGMAALFGVAIAHDR